jgi:hypothetical protein
MTFTMSACRHVVDGGTDAKFLATPKKFVEEPASRLLQRLCGGVREA